MRLGLIFAAGVLVTFAQTAPQPRFDVASVKPGGEAFSTRPERLQGRIRWTTQLCYLIGYAYHLDFSRVTGQSCGAVYAIEATFEPSATDDQVRQMVQALLADRFKMRAHRATTEAEGYGLTIGKDGIKIREADPSGEPPPMPEWVKRASPALKSESYISATVPEAGVTAITGRRVTMAQLAETLQRSIQTPVWDRTGLTGAYYFAFRYAQDLSTDLSTDHVTDAPTLAAALRESLGLRLEKQKGPVETLVIDSIAEPSGN